jgi:FAD/FMN-containing dehydrogenase
MPQQNPLIKAAAHFAKILGEHSVLRTAQQLHGWQSDWSKAFIMKPGMVVMPQTTAQVAAVLSYCGSHGIPVVPSGGRTGLVGGAIAQEHEIILSLQKMNKIIGVDRENMSIDTEAGVVTEDLQRVAREHGLFFPIDLASKGSCQIGGNIATNAGGLKFIRFGGTREQVLGLEVVLADGTILNLNRSLRKDNTGYDLKQLFIGSEGTLGIITRATLRLTPAPKDVHLLCLAVSSIAQLTGIFALSQQRGLTLSAFEFFSHAAFAKVKSCFPQVKDLCSSTGTYYALVEVEGDLRSLAPQVEEFSEELFRSNLADDGTIATSSQERRELWFARESITESLSTLGHVRKNDISLPLSYIGAFCKDLAALPVATEEGYEMVLFGHLGDGNIHLNFFAPKTVNADAFRRSAEVFSQEVLSLVRKYQGSISAEHGIGLLKKGDLPFSRSADEISLMKSIKHLLDGKNLLNPGKIF